MKHKFKKNNSLFSYYDFTKKDKKECPVISKILKELTSEKIKKEIKAIQKVKLSPEFQKWVKEYEKVGERDEFIWRWLYKMFQIFFLPTVSKRCQKPLWETKVLMTMFIVQIDDIADKKQERKLLDELLKIPLEQENIKLNNLSLKNKKHLVFTKKIWNHIKKQIKKYPRYKELEEILNYDIIQILNAMEYSYLVNKNPQLINKTESWLYSSYNMVVFVYSDFDLMCSLNFNFQKLGAIREIIWRAQKMARIGNWISTWEREIKERDFTSGVFAYVINSGNIMSDDLKKKDNLEIIRKIKKSKIEKKLLQKWEQYYFEIEKLGKKMKKINIKEFLSRLQKLIILHLISRGYK